MYGYDNEEKEAKENGPVQYSVPQIELSVRKYDGSLSTNDSIVFYPIPFRIRQCS